MLTNQNLQRQEATAIWKKTCIASHPEMRTVASMRRIRSYAISKAISHPQNGFGAKTKGAAINVASFSPLILGRCCCCSSDGLRGTKR